MRKITKMISFIMILSLCLSFCGCDILDNLRVSRAAFTTDGNIQLWDGSAYKLLPECADLTPAFNKFEMVYVVDEEVPLLLTGLLGDSFIMSDDKIFLQSSTEESDIYYCRTDVYDSVLERINGGFSGDMYGYWYYDYEEDQSVFYVLTPQQAETVSQVYHTQTPETLPEAAYLDYTYRADLFICTNDKLFMRDTVDVCTLKGKYYVVSYDLNATTLYGVPEELSDIFAEILEKQVESDDYWNSDW